MVTTETGIWLDSGQLSKGITASASEEKRNGALESPEIEANLCIICLSTEEAVGHLVHRGGLCLTQEGLVTVSGHTSMTVGYVFSLPSPSFLICKY